MYKGKKLWKMYFFISIKINIKKKLKFFVAPFLDDPKLFATKVADYTTNGIEIFFKTHMGFF
jgi:hypothetical protein